MPTFLRRLAESRNRAPALPAGAYNMGAGGWSR